MNKINLNISRHFSHTAEQSKVYQIKFLPTKAPFPKQAQPALFALELLCSHFIFWGPSSAQLPHINCSLLVFQRSSSSLTHWVPTCILLLPSSMQKDNQNLCWALNPSVSPRDIQAAALCCWGHSFYTFLRNKHLAPPASDAVSKTN